MVLSLCCVAVSMDTARAQFGRGAGDWMTIGGDAQRSSWIRTDPKISLGSMQKPGFRFLWKVKLVNGQDSNPLAVPVLINFYIGYRGFRALAFVGGSSNDLHAIDTDLGRIEWQNRFPAAASQQGGAKNCGGTTIAVTRPATVAFPTTGGGAPFGPGRGGPARSGVGNPDEGAVTLTQAAAPRPVPTPLPAPGAPGRGAPGGGAPGGPGGFRMPSLIYALTSDGMLHTMYLSNGTEAKPPVRFLPANANAQGLIVVDDIAYITTAPGCDGVPAGVWALNLGSKEIATWEAKGGVSGSAGPAFGPDGTVYVATGRGGLAALDPKTLALKDSYETDQEFTSSPVVFQYKDKTLLAAASKDGRIHLLDSKGLAGVYKTPVSSNAVVGGALASWQDAAGTRWVLAPTAGAIAAWKLVDRNEAPALEPGWVSRDMLSPLPPMVINGVVFAASSGKSPAVLYALDGVTGKELWNSGNAIASSVHGGGLSGGGSQVYLGTSDSTLHAFGFYIEH